MSRRACHATWSATRPQRASARAPRAPSAARHPALSIFALFGRLLFSQLRRAGAGSHLFHLFRARFLVRVRAPLLAYSFPIIFLRLSSRAAFKACSRAFISSLLFPRDHYHPRLHGRRHNCIRPTSSIWQRSGSVPVPVSPILYRYLYR